MITSTSACYTNTLDFKSEVVRQNMKKPPQKEISMYYEIGSHDNGLPATSKDVFYSKLRKKSKKWKNLSNLLKRDINVS